MSPRARRFGIIAVVVLLLLGAGNYLVYTRLIKPSGGVIPSKVMVMKGESMAPTIHEGDRVAFRRIKPGSGSPQRGEIVLFSDPSKPERLLIKRVIAVGGDRVRIEGGITYLNGQPLQEPYLLQGAAPAPDMPERGVSAGAIWVLGDNRGRSLDSRYFGDIPLDLVWGIAITEAGGRN